jgi:conjugative element/phage-associated large polyvalent protein
LGVRTYNAVLKRNDGSFETKVTLKMKKDSANRVLNKLHEPFVVEQYFLELSGIINGEERESKIYIMFGKNDIRNPETLDQDLTQYITSFPEIFTTDNIGEVINARDDFMNEHMLIQDNRKTLEEKQEDKEKMVKLNEQHAKERAEQKVKDDIVKAKLLKEYPYLLIFDNNTKLSSHAHCAKNIRAELKRKYPNFKFSVTSESFSMGNAVRVGWTDGPTEKEIGNIAKRYEYGTFNGMIDMYESHHSVFNDTFGSIKYASTSRTLTKQRYIEAAEAMKVHIVFDQHDNMDYIKNDRDVQRRVSNWVRDTSFYVKQEVPVETDGTENGVRYNSAKNGIEIKFDSKPEQEVIDNLKSKGFRWSRFSKVWWRKYSEADMKLAQEIFNGTNN